MATQQTSRVREQDGAPVAGGQKHEVRDEAKKKGKSGHRVKQAVPRFGKIGISAVAAALHYQSDE